MAFIFKWLNDKGKEFGAIADNVDEARKEIDKSPIITDKQAQIANDNPPSKIEHVRPPSDEED